MMKTAAEIQIILESFENDYNNAINQLTLFEHNHNPNYENSDYSEEINRYKNLTKVLGESIFAHNSSLIAIKAVA